MAGVESNLDEKINREQQERANPVSSDLYKQEQAGYDREFNDMVNNFDQTTDSRQDNANINTAKTAEENPASPWKTDVDGNSKNNTTQVTGKAKWGQKKGPMSAIIVLILTGGTMLSMLGTPGLLIVHFKEIMLEKFNTQLASMDDRTTRLMSAKITGATSGHCGATITIRCKYTSLTKAQLQQFKDAGITINEKKSFKPGRIGVESMEYKGETIAAKDFNSKILSDDTFKSAVKEGFKFNSKFAGFASEGWRKTADRLGITKRSPIEGAKDDADRTAKLNEAVRNGFDTEVNVPKAGADKGDGTTYTEDEVKALQAEADRVAAEVDSAARSGTRAGAQTLSAIDGLAAGAANSAINAVKVTGVADIGCQAYNSVRALGFAAKTIRAVQLARYAMAFLTMADQIKAGDAKPEDVAYFGGILTEVAYDAKGAATRKAATDSFGFKYAAYGDTSGYSKNSYLSQFMAGGGLTGDLIHVTDEINAMIGGAPREICKTLANPWVQAGSLIGGIAIFATGVGAAGITVKAGVGIAAQVALSLALVALPDLLKDIVAGNAVNNLKGEDSGNGITSGSSGMFNQVAAANGNAPMTKQDAVAYLKVQDQVIARINEEDRRTLSPLDATNKNTFLGSITLKLLPLTPSTANPGSTLTSLGSVFSSAFTGLIPKTSALTDLEKQQSLELCQDPDYKELGVATDPFCNVINGIPPQYLNRDPIAVASALEGQYNDETGEPISGSAYADFYSKCIDRDYTQNPLGSGEDINAEKSCVINESNANYYLFYSDRQVLGMLENGYILGDPASKTTESAEASQQTTQNTGSAIRGDDYPYKTSPKFTMSPLGYGFRECVDFVAWRLNVQSGVTKEPFQFSGYGNAISWRQNALSRGFAVDKKPKVGAVAWWGNGVSAVTTAGSYGHVAIVSQVNADGSIIIEQYNGMAFPNDHKYSTDTVPASLVGNLDYLHIADIKGGSV